MNAVGIDISKGKSMVAALRPMGEVALTPREFPHTELALEQMANAIIGLGEETRVVMEATGRYHEPVAAALHEYRIFVSVLNPLYIKQSGGGSIRKVKTDKADAMKIAKYTLDNWVKLQEYTPMDAIRQQLRLYSRQYDLYMKTNVALQNNLISLTDKVYPGVNELFSSPECPDGHQKWVDFVMTFWHRDCLCRISQEAFTERYWKWCKRKGYNFSPDKAIDVYAGSRQCYTTLPRNSNTKMLITTAARQLTDARAATAALRQEMIRLAQQLSEYEMVRAMYGVGDVTTAQLIAEIGDVRRFSHRSSLVAFAGVDPAVNQSGKHIAQTNPATKRGSLHLRKILYQVVCTYLKKSPADEPVYQFLNKKHAEGKPYFVYMTAAQNKFLRIYYARVKECLTVAGCEPPEQE